MKSNESRRTSYLTMDIRDLIAPLTLLKVESRLVSMESGQVLEIICIDEETKVDLARIAKNAGHGYTATSDQDDAYRIFIQRR